MSGKRNEVLIEWTEGSCKGGTNRVNVKHILLDAEDIAVGAFMELSSSFFSSILSMYSAMFFVITEGRPDLRWSTNPAPLVQQKIRRVTARLVVTMSSSASFLTICAGVLPCCHSRTICSRA